MPLPPSDPARSGPPFAALLAVVLVLALAARVPLTGLAASGYRLTEAFSIEEVENVRISTGMLHERTLNPHAFEYPSLFYYLSLAVEAPLAALGRDRWSDLLVAVRWISVLAGVATVALVGLLGRRIAGPWAGLLAAVVLAFDRTHVDVSALAKPNALQVMFVTAGFLALTSLAARPRPRAAAGAALLFGLAAASKWLGALGLAGLVVAPLLGQRVDVAAGLRRLAAAARAAWGARLPAWQVLLPFAVFGATFLACVPFALLSPREFGFGLAQTFMAQSLHRRDLPSAAPLSWLARSMGPLGAALAAAGVAHALARLRRWDGSAAENARVLVLGWTLAYGTLVMFVFVRLPSYLDLWTPFLAVLAGCSLAAIPRAWQGRVAPAAAALALVVGLFTNAHHGFWRAALERHDTRVAAGEWLARHARAGERVLADLGAFVPDSLGPVDWNWWGSPPRVIHDETVTWGRDPRWPEWYGGHRRLLFVNAKWTHPESLLARRPVWIVTTSDWTGIRRAPTGAAETRAAVYDRVLADGSAGYVEVARFRAEPGVRDPGWTVAPLPAAAAPALLAGPELVLFRRAAPDSAR